MNEILSHAERIAKAFFHIARSMEKGGIRSHIERGAAHLIAHIHREDLSSARRTLSLLQTWIRLGEASYTIESKSADLLRREIETLSSRIDRGDAEIKKWRAREISEMLDGTTEKQEFSEDIEIKMDNSAISAEISSEIVPRTEISAEINSEKRLASEISAEMYDSDEKKMENALLRQSAILAAMRKAENGRIQLKDISSLFPDVTERTLRYDLKRLIARGVVEKLGLGGPSTFYVIK